MILKNNTCLFDLEQLCHWISMSQLTKPRLQGLDICFPSYHISFFLISNPILVPLQGPSFQVDSSQLYFSFLWSSINFKELLALVKPTIQVTSIEMWEVNLGLPRRKILPSDWSISRLFLSIHSSSLQLKLCH